VNVEFFVGERLFPSNGFDTALALGRPSCRQLAPESVIVRKFPPSQGVGGRIHKFPLLRVTGGFTEMAIRVVTEVAPGRELVTLPSLLFEVGVYILRRLLSLAAKNGGLFLPCLILIVMY
jgi:hypothetical protein